MSVPSLADTISPAREITVIEHEYEYEYEELTNGRPSRLTSVSLRQVFNNSTQLLVHKFHERSLLLNSSAPAACFSLTIPITKGPNNSSQQPEDSGVQCRPPPIRPSTSPREEEDPPRPQPGPPTPSPSPTSPNPTLAQATHPHPTPSPPASRVEMDAPPTGPPIPPRTRTRTPNAPKAKTKTKPKTKTSSQQATPPRTPPPPPTHSLLCSSRPLTRRRKNVRRA